MADLDETNPEAPVVLLSPTEMARCDEMSTLLMRQHYQEGVLAEACNHQWADFLANQLLGTATYERVQQLGDKVSWRVVQPQTNIASPSSE